MYSLLVSKLERSLAYVLANARAAEQASLKGRRNSFLQLFALYCSLEEFVTRLEKAVVELNCIANGGVIVRTAMQNILDKSKHLAGYLGNNICGLLPNRGGFGYVSMEATDQEEGALRDMGLYRFFVSSPFEGRAKGSMSHSFRELCPRVAAENGRPTYEVVYVRIKPTLTAAKLYEGIDYNAVRLEDRLQHVAKCVSENIEKQPCTSRVDMRSTKELAELLRGSNHDVAIMNQKKREYADHIRRCFTVETLLQ